VSNIRVSKEYFTTTMPQSSLVLIPLLGVVLPTTSVHAQVTAANDGAATIVNIVGEAHVEGAPQQIDITGGTLSSDRSNLFQSFEQFDLTAEQTANFVTTADVQNVFGRISGGASNINGTLQISGSSADLYLMNPAGILMGPEAQLNLSGGFTAATATGIGFETGQFSATSSPDYQTLNGPPQTFQFAHEQAGAVVNLGDLSVKEGQAISLIGGTVVSTGNLSAPGGTITMTGVEGESLVRISQGEQLLSLEVDIAALSPTTPDSEDTGDRDSPAQPISNLLTGGNLGHVSALVSNTDGSVSLSDNGMTIAETGGAVIATGLLSSAHEIGGNINILGTSVSLTNAHLDASGENGGGLIRVGGDYQGQGNLHTALQTSVDTASVLSANAVAQGNGGRVIVWADDTTQFQGNIQAQGGALQGNGGFAEVSGKTSLDFSGSINLSAPQGQLGTVLLDPQNLVITDGPPPVNNTATSYLSSSALEALSNTANVNLEATNNITINNLADNRLTFQRGRAVTFTADSDRDGRGAFTMDRGDRIDVASGNVLIRAAGINTGAIATDLIGTTGENGGDITLESSLGVETGPLSTNVFFGSDGSGEGGDIRIEAENGDIVVDGLIKTWSYSQGSGAGSAGDVSLQASGDITTDRIFSVSRADVANTGAGGNITLTSSTGNIEVNNRIDTGATTGGGIGNQSGAIDISASAGRVSVRTISALSSSGSERSGDIVLTGNELTFEGGNNSISGGSIGLNSGRLDQDISLGIPTELLGPSVLTLDIDAIGSASSLNIGNANGTGTLTITPEVLANPFSRPEISLLGGTTLVGTGANSNFDITDGSSGTVLGGNITFANIESFSGINTLSYENYAGSAPLEVDINNLSNIQTVIGAQGQSSILRGENTNNVWEITGENQGLVNSSLRFENFNNLIGGSAEDQFSFVGSGFITGDINGNAANDTLDFSQYNAPIKVDLASMQVNNGLTFGSIERVVGSDADSDSLSGSSRDDSFEITGDRTGSINDTLDFSDIETLNGRAGVNTFYLNDLTTATNLTLIGGSNLSDSQSNNRIVTNLFNPLWQIDQSGQGSLQKENETLVNFREIQHLENTSTTGGEQIVRFESNAARITGSINSGSHNLTLLGDNINIGHANGNNDNLNAAISGLGKLTIRPKTNSISTVIGNVETQQSGRLNITDGELAAIQNSFSEIAFGGEDTAGDISVVSDVNFQSSVLLRSQASISTQGIELSTTSGDITLQADGSINSGSLTAQTGSVRLMAQQDITVSAATAQGGEGITLTSEAGQITVEDRLDTSGTLLGNNINLAAKTTINIGSINTSGGQRSGDVTLRSAVADITTKGITTANGTDENEAVSRRPGNVELSSPGSIQVEFIDARGRGNNTATTRIDISTQDTFQSTGSMATPEAAFATENTSLSTLGAREGSVRISYGRSDRLANRFQIGTASDNGSAFGITTPQTAIVAGDFARSYTQSNIELINNGSLPPDVFPSLPTNLTPDTPQNLPLASTQNRPIDSFGSLTTSETETLLKTKTLRAELFTLSSTTDDDAEDILEKIEIRNDQAFREYLGIADSDQARPTSQLGDIQETLKEISRATEVQPALVYVYFVPDISAETVVANGPVQNNSPANHIANPNDRLEIVLITPEGEPIRRRQWGITREEVETANQTLRQRVTSQFSTERQYLPPAQQLYNWMIEPISEVLQNQDINSLGFIMDSGLRTMPMATLHDGESYLINNYSLGVLPSFSLSNIDTTTTLNRQSFSQERVLAMGASEFQGLPSLPGAGAEVNLIAQGLGEGDAFLNEDFILKNLKTQLEQEDYGVIHLATHAVFESGNLDNSYIQLWDEKLSLSELGNLKLSEEDLSLIILSACNTAFGDYEAEYGFAGLAVSTGAEAALASLWPVNDEGTLGFMVQFYSHLQSATVRAEALRQTQLQLINGEVGIENGVVYGPDGNTITTLPELAESGRWDFSHPFYWSPFTMIGNPW